MWNKKKKKYIYTKYIATIKLEISATQIENGHVCGMCGEYPIVRQFTHFSSRVAKSGAG